MTRRLAVVLALALALGACPRETVSTTTNAPPGSTSTTVTSTTTTTTAQVTTTTLPEPTWDTLPGIDALPQEVQDELLALVRTTEEIRGLRFQEPPTISIVTEQELEQRVRAQIEEESDDFPADEALYKLLGLLEDDVNLQLLLPELYCAPGAGSYH